MGISLTDDSGNLRDIIQVYTEVAEKVKGISDSERIAVVEGLAGKYHIARMQVLLDDLGSADSMYRQMYDSSVNSTGSAMEENEKFMKSLQARINLAKVEVEKLALAMGDAFLTEGMIQGIQLFGSFLSAVTAFVDKFGVLPALMGTAGVALFLLSSRFKLLTASVSTGIASLLGFRGAAASTAAASALTSTALRGLSIAFKSLLASTGVGLALVGVGLAIEGILGHMSKQREIQEEMAQSNRELSESYAANRESIESLSTEYATLEKAMEASEPHTTTQERYYEVQNKLAELMPNLVKYEDSYGNKILGTSTVIESKIKLLEKQILTEERLQEIKDKETSDEKEKQAEKDVISGKFGAKEFKRSFGEKASSFLTGYAYTEEIKNLQDMEAALTYFEKKKKELLDVEGNSNKTRAVVEVSGTIEGLERILGIYKEHTNKMESAQAYLTNKYAENAEKIILENHKLSDSTKDLATDMLYDFTSMAKSSEEAKSISEVFGDGDFQNSISDAQKAVKVFTSSTSEDFINQKKVFTDYSSTLKEAMLSNMKDSKGNPLDDESKAYKNAEASLQSYIDKLVLREQAVKDYANTNGMSMEQARTSISLIDQEGAVIDEATDEMAEYIEKLRELSSASEKIVGVSQNQIDEVEDLIYVYQTLSSQTNLTASQTEELALAEARLAAIYPSLVQNGEIRIDNIMAEKEAELILLKATEAMKDGKLTADEAMTLSSAQSTKVKIENIRVEMAALQKLMEAYALAAQVASETSYQIASGMDADAEITARKFAGAGSRNQASYNNMSSELDGLIGSLGGYTAQLRSSPALIDAFSDSTDKSTKATEESAKENERASFVADKYALSLEKINMALQEQQRIQEDFPDFSKQYRDSLEAEIKLNKDKTALLNEQATSLESQIKSGKILETGVIKSSSSSAYSGKYETEINKASSKYGVDANLISAIIKQESNFNAKAKSGSGAEGLMQLMPATAKELGVKDAYDAEQNIMGGTKYFAQQLAKFGGDVKQALYAYNAGAGNVSKILSSSSKEWTGAKDYASKIMGNLATVSNNAVETAKLNGWSGKVTSGFGERKAPKKGASTNHQGIDIAGNKGDRLDSNVNGKVTFAGKGTGSYSGFGNYVAIETADGLKHFYAHLDKVIAKVGDTVAVGSQIGNIGSTGTSTGNHLHYQVNENGKAIDPTTTASLANTMSVDAANGLKSIEDARSQLLSIQGQLFDTNEATEELQSKIIQSFLAEFENNRHLFDYTLDFETAKQEAMSKTSKEYIDSIDKQITAMTSQQAINQKELVFLDDLIKNGGLTAKAMTEAKERVKELNVSTLQLAASIEQTNFEKIGSRNKSFDESQDDIQQLIDLSAEYQKTLEEGSPEYIAETEKQIALSQKSQRMTRNQVNELKEYLKTMDLAPETIKGINETIEDLEKSSASATNSIREMKEALSGVKFQVNDDAIQDTQDKIDFLSWQLGLLGEEDIELKIKLNAEISDSLNDIIGDIDKGISDAYAERSIAISDGRSTKLYDDKMEGYVSQRRSQIGEMHNIYNEMQSMVTDAADKIKDAETKAYQDASDAIDKIISETEARLSVFTNAVDVLERKLATVQESNFADKIGVTSSQLSETKKLTRAIIAEYDKLASTPVYNEEQKKQVESQLQSLKGELGSANLQIIEYTKNLERTHFEKLIYGAKEASKEIDRLTNRMNKNLELLDGGMLSGQTLNLSADSLVGNTLDLGSLISDPLAERDIQVAIQDIKTSSYGQQIKDAEAYHADMQAKADQFQKVMLDEQVKFEENLKLLTEIQDEAKKKSKDETNKELLDSTKKLTEEELSVMTSHYDSLKSAMTMAMSLYRTEYASIWDGIIADTTAKLAVLESKLSKAKSASTTATKTAPKYANGTNGHRGGLAVVGDGRKSELILYPNGQIGLSDNKDQLVNLPKGTQVISGKETESILNGKNIPKYANGTSGSLTEKYKSAGYNVDESEIGKLLMDNFGGKGGFQLQVGAGDTLISFPRADLGSQYNSILSSQGENVANLFYDMIKEDYGKLFPDAAKIDALNKKVGEKIEDLNSTPTQHDSDFWNTVNKGDVTSNVRGKFGDLNEYFLTPEMLKDYGSKNNLVGKFGFDSILEDYTGFYNSEKEKWEESRGQASNEMDAIRKQELANLLKYGNKNGYVEQENYGRDEVAKDAWKVLDVSENEQDKAIRQRAINAQKKYEETEIAKGAKQFELFGLNFLETIEGKVIQIGDYHLKQSEGHYVNDYDGDYNPNGLVVKEGVLDSGLNTLSLLMNDLDGNYLEVAINEVMDKMKDGWQVIDQNPISADYAIKWVDAIDNYLKYGSLKGKPVTGSPTSPDGSTGNYDNIGTGKKKVTYSDEFIKKYDPYDALGSTPERDRKAEMVSIGEIQKLLDKAEKDNDETTIAKLTEDILNRQSTQTAKDQQFIIESLTDLSQQRQKVAQETRNELAKALQDTSLTEEAQNYYRDEIASLDDEIANAQLEQKKLIKQSFDYEQTIRNKRLSDIKKEQDAYQFVLELNQALNPFDYSKSIPAMQSMYDYSVNYTKELESQKQLLEQQMKQLEVGSYEWNFLSDQVEDYTNQIKQSLLAQQKMRKDLLNEQFNSALKKVEMELFDGKTQQEATDALNDKYKLQDLFVDGLEKQLEVEKIIDFARKGGVTLSKEELTILNSKDKIEKKALERLQKQLEIRELEQRLLNLNMEKNIQQLTKSSDGTWDYSYVVDQDAIDVATDELRDKKLELIKFEEDVERTKEKEELDAKTDYFNKLKSVIDKALNGEITDFNLFSEALTGLNSNFLLTLSDDSKTQWDSIFANMSNNVFNMKESFRTYVDDLKVLVAEAEQELAKLAKKKEDATKNNQVIVDKDKNTVTRGDSNYSTELLREAMAEIGSGNVDDAMNYLDNHFGVKRFDTGGYTANSEGLAYLDKKEIVLKDTDTANLLSAIDITRNIATMFKGFNPTQFLKSKIQETSQIFHIANIEFPNVTNSTGFEDVLKNLPNVAMARVRT